MKMSRSYGRKTTLWAAGLAALLVLAGCDQGSEDVASSEAQPAKQVVIKVGHVVSETNAGHQGMLELNRLLGEKTDGRVSLEIFPSSQLGSERELIEAVQLDNIGMAFVSSAPLGGFKKEFFALDLPFVFKDRAMVYKVLDGEPGQQMLASLDDINIKGLGYWENGFRQFSNNRGPVTTPSDLNGIKMRTMENEIHLATWKALGSNPAPLAFGELFTALQQGTFDAQETPINLFRDTSFHEVQKHITKTNHLYSPYVVIMSKSLYEGLSSADQQALAEAFAQAQTFQRELSAKHDEEAEKQLTGTVTFTELNDAQRAEFVNKMGPVYDLVKQKAGNEIVDKVLKSAS